MVFWHAELVGWIICREQSVEKTVEFASSYETNVTDLYGSIRVPWVRLPQCMTERWILGCKLIAKGVVVVHLGATEVGDEHSTLECRGGADGGRGRAGAVDNLHGHSIPAFKRPKTWPNMDSQLAPAVCTVRRSHIQFA